MKILVISDVEKWEGYERLVDEVRPDVVVLAGDLTSDGFASFWWSEWFEGNIPGFLDEEMKLRNMHGGNLSTETLCLLKKKYMNTKEFHEIRKRTHVDKFYQFLEYAGKKSSVLVVKGNHDDDFNGDYDPKRIDKISGCREISGKSIDVHGVCFLGLGFNETHYKRVLKKLINVYRERVDIVVMHGENILAVSFIKPKLIIRGGYSTGKYLVNDVPSVWNSCGIYTVIKFENKEIQEISQHEFGRKVFRPQTISHKYKWLKPL